MEEIFKCEECKKDAKESELNECDMCGGLVCENCSHTKKNGLTFCIWHKYVGYDKEDWEDEESDNERK